LDYAVEKCVDAAELLAISDAPLRARLRNAYESAFARLSADDIPEDARASFVKLKGRLERVADAEHGGVEARLREASDPEVMEIAMLAWDVISAVLYSVTGHGG
jgi:hypothetical protein